VNFVLN